MLKQQKETEFFPHCSVAKGSFLFYFKRGRGFSQNWKPEQFLLDVNVPGRQLEGLPLLYMWRVLLQLGGERGKLGVRRCSAYAGASALQLLGDTQIRPIFRKCLSLHSFYCKSLAEQTPCSFPSTPARLKGCRCFGSSMLPQKVGQDRLLGFPCCGCAALHTGLCAPQQLWTLPIPFQKSNICSGTGQFAQERLAKYRRSLCSL